MKDSEGNLIAVMGDNVSPDQVEGILDTIRELRDLPIGDLTDMFRAVRAKDKNEIRRIALKLIKHWSPAYAPDAKEVDDIVEHILKYNLGGIVYESGDAMMKYAVKYLHFANPQLPPAPNGINSSGVQVMSAPVGAPPEFLGEIESVMVMGKKVPIDQMTAEQSRQWLGTNRGLVKDGSELWIVRRRFRSQPELISMLHGDADQVDVGAIDKERLITFIERSIPFLSIAAALCPPPWNVALGAVIVALKLIVQNYHQNNPEVGLTFSDLLVPGV